MSADQEPARSGDLQDEGRADTRFEPPDLLYIRLAGILDEAEAIRGVEALVSSCARAPNGGLVLADLRDLTSITPAARREAVQRSKSAVIRAAAMVGASFHVRVLVTLVRKGAQLVLGRSYPLRFFNTEIEARQWLVTQRAPEPAARTKP
jgi:hypothetical protein